MDDPTRPVDDPAWGPEPPLDGPGSLFVRDLTHAIFAFLDRRAILFAEELASLGDDPSDVVVYIAVTLRGLADGFELGSLTH